MINQIMKELTPAIEADTILIKEFTADERDFYNKRLSDVLDAEKKGNKAEVINILQRKFERKKLPDNYFESKFENDFQNHISELPNTNKDIFRIDEIERIQSLISTITSIVGKEHSRTFHSVETAKSYVLFLQNSITSEKNLYHNPQSLEFDIDNDDLLSLYDEWKKFIICANTDYCYFQYAIKGESIPREKQPYQPIKLKTSKASFRHALIDLQDKYVVKQVTVTSKNKRKVKELFLDEKGKPLTFSNT